MVQELALSLAEEGFDSPEIILSVDADGIELGGFDVDAETVFEKSKLFEPLGSLKKPVRKCGKAFERVFTVGVEADVFPVLRTGFVAVIRDGGAGEVECTAIGCSHNFYGIGITDVFGGAENLKRGDIDMRLSKRTKECVEVL